LGDVSVHYVEGGAMIHEEDGGLGAGYIGGLLENFLQGWKVKKRRRVNCLTVMSTESQAG
jgi:hypothetical protein